MTKRLPAERWQQLPYGALDGDDEALIGSGVIEINNDNVLLEIGDSPYLLHRKVNEHGVQLEGYGFIDKVPKRVSSIAEALVLTKEPDGQVIVCNEWWTEPQAEAFTPPAFDPELIKIMSVPLNPIEFGFNMDELQVETIGYGDDETAVLVPQDALLSGTLTSRARAWIDKRKEWRAASRKWTNRKPVVYQNITTQTQRFSRGNNSGSGEIVRTGQGVYIRGMFHSMNDWTEVIILNKWHKLMNPVSRMKVKSG
jgi:hypothetical protein